MYICKFNMMCVVLEVCVILQTTACVRTYIEMIWQCDVRTLCIQAGHAALWTRLLYHTLLHCSFLLHEDATEHFECLVCSACLPRLLLQEDESRQMQDGCVEGAH